ncbi:MAG: hypothetical protein NXI35_33140 [bacterium]|nr:hypothetical protein [bacterium]
MGELQSAEVRAAFERALLQAAAENMRAAAALIVGGSPPGHEALTDAGVLCTDAGSLLELVYNERFRAEAAQDGDDDEIRA